MFLQYYSYNVHTNSDYSKEKKKRQKKKLTLYNKKIKTIPVIGSARRIL